LKVKHAAILKIDCEGCEYEVLNAAPKSVLQSISYLRGETHSALGTSIDPNAKQAMLDKLRPIFNKRGELYEVGGPKVCCG